MRSTLLLLALTLWCDTLPQTISAPKRQAPITAAEWIEQLASRRHAERELAMTELKKIGSKAIPELQKALKHRDPEVRTRSQMLIAILECQNYVQPSRITINAKDLAIGTVLDDISNQTGYKFESYDGGQEQKMSLTMKDVPFWEAMEKFSKASGFIIGQSYGMRQIRLTRQSQTCPYTCISGAFRFSANTISQHRSVNLSYVDPTRGPSRSSSLNFSFNAQAEPRLMILGYEGMNLTAAYDDLGNSMLPPKQEDRPEWQWEGRRHSLYGNGYNSVTISLSTNLIRPSAKAERLKVVRGYVPLTLLVEDKKVTVLDNLMKAKDTKVEIGKTHFHIEWAKELPNNQYQFKMTITNNEITDNNDYSWSNSLYNRIEVVDKAGNKLSNYGSSWSNSSASQVVMTRTYGSSGNKVAEPLKLVYHQWKTMHHPVRFELKDMPLP